MMFGIIGFLFYICFYLFLLLYLFVFLYLEKTLFALGSIMYLKEHHVP